MVPITQLGYHWKAIMSFFFSLLMSCKWQAKAASETLVSANNPNKNGFLKDRVFGRDAFGSTSIP